MSIIIRRKPVTDKGESRPNAPDLSSSESFITPVRKTFLVRSVTALEDGAAWAKEVRHGPSMWTLFRESRLVDTLLSYRSDHQRTPVRQNDLVNPVSLLLQANGNQAAISWNTVQSFHATIRRSAWDQQSVLTGYINQSSDGEPFVLRFRRIDGTDFYVWVSSERDVSNLVGVPRKFIRKFGRWFGLRPAVYMTLDPLDIDDEDFELVPQHPPTLLELIRYYLEMESREARVWDDIGSEEDRIMLLSDHIEDGIVKPSRRDRVLGGSDQRYRTDPASLEHAHNLIVISLGPHRHFPATRMLAAWNAQANFTVKSVQCLTRAEDTEACLRFTGSDDAGWSAFVDVRESRGDMLEWDEESESFQRCDWDVTVEHFGPKGPPDWLAQDFPTDETGYRRTCERRLDLDVIEAYDLFDSIRRRFEGRKARRNQDSVLEAFFCCAALPALRKILVPAKLREAL